MTTLKIGDQAPQFSGVDQDGKSHQLADYKGKKLLKSSPALIFSTG